MEQELETPQTLMQAIRYFSQPGVALAFVAKLRWPNGPFCEKCGQTDPMFLKSVERWKCRGCGNQFSVKRGSIMEDSPVSLEKWLCAMWLIANCKNGVSSYEIHREIGVTQKTGWFMLQRIRLAMQAGAIRKMRGHVEADETYIGGKITNMSKSKRRALGKKKGPSSGKAIIAGILEGGGDVHAMVMPDGNGERIRNHIRQHVEPGSRLSTDSSPIYSALGKEYDHASVNHFAEEYVRGEVHTNSIENFWSVLKRGLHGTYINVEPFHLFRYLDEQIFRFNLRKTDNAGRFERLLSRLAGKRLTYKALVGGMEPQTC